MAWHDFQISGFSELDVSVPNVFRKVLIDMLFYDSSLTYE